MRPRTSQTRRLSTLTATCVAAAMILTACGSSSSSTDSSAAAGSGSAAAGGDELAGVELTVGNKDFSEQEILKEITKQLFEAHGATIDDKGTIVGSVNTRKALESGEIDLYWDYTGTGWITYLGNTTPVQGAQAQYEAVRDADLEKNGIVWLPPAPFRLKPQSNKLRSTIS